MSRNIYDRPIRLEGSTIDRHFLIAPKKASLKDRILLSPIFKYVVPVIVVIAILMTAVYLTLYFILDNETNSWPSTCNIKASYRVECFPGKVNVTYDQCSEVECCWNDETKFCFHSVPSRHGYTQRNSDFYKENEVLVPRTTSSPLGSKNVESMTLELKNIDANHVEIIFKIDQTKNRKRRHIGEKKSSPRPRKFEANKDGLTEELLDFLPNNLERESVNIQSDDKSQMNVYVHVPEFSVTVTRKNNATSSVLSTARGPFILTETFWEFTLYVTNSSLYGLNQLELNGTTHWIYDNENGTAKPSFLGIDDNGQGIACYVNYEGPMEIKVLDESNLVVLRGMSLPQAISLHVFAGPTPLEAVSQLTKALNLNARSETIPASSLGLHVCPNDDSIEFIESLNEIIERMTIMNAPWDSHCLHQGFNPTLGNSLNETQAAIFAKAVELLGGERLLVPHLSAMLFTSNNALASELAKSSLLLRDNSDPYVGWYRNRRVVYPDWLEPETFTESLTNLTNYLSTYASSKLLYLRDSWPKDENKEHSVLDSRRFDYLPSELRELMSNGTVPYSLKFSSSANYHYVKHNEYAEKFRNFVRVVDESTSLMTRGLPGESGNSSWAALREAIRVGVGSCLIGQLPPPMYVCGTSKKSDVGSKNNELCSRWYGSSVMWPHVLALPPKLPGGDHLEASSSLYAVKHLKLRASLMTYARTILAKYYIDGAPILAPTSIYYPEDMRARRRWNQFFWGDSILVGLVTLPQVTQVLMWLPGKNSWRHLEGGSEFHPSVITATSIPAVAGQIVTLIRPGFIVPVHEEVSMTAVATMRSDLTLVTNLDCGKVDCTAEGKIFYGSSSNDDVFLFIEVSQLNNYIQLKNVLRVKERACNDDTTILAQHPRVIKSVEILGISMHTVNINLCSMTNDVFKTSL